MRNRLHITKLAEFEAHCRSQGWNKLEPKGFYEALRMSHPGKQGVLLVHQRADAKEHLTLSGHSLVEYDTWKGMPAASKPSDKLVDPAARQQARTERNTLSSAPWE